MQRTNQFIVIILVIVIAVGATFIVWYTQFFRSVSRMMSQGPMPVAAPRGNDLGTTLYEQSQNPIKEKLPRTTATAPNPIEGLYKNPFE